MKLRITNYELRIDWRHAVIFSTTLFLFSQSCFGQEPLTSDPGFFLEPNRFSVTKELGARPLWLAMGLGRPIFLFQGVHIGLEGLAWSRLEALSDFRFPVETVDYFFGIFFTQSEGRDAEWKLRISHISSHLVDGTDSVFGGSSSHYSREFVELTRRARFGSHEEFQWTFGLRGYFHQVTKIEPWIAVPASLTWNFAQYAPELFYDSIPPGSTAYTFSAFVSSGDGPVWPTVTAGLRADRFAKDLGILDLQLYYQYGASWAGTDAGAKRSTINLQMDVRGF
ncbi:MAG TPA: hypothetical protein VFH95_08620 [Candidatus Kapabacteria bacterium]|nr:hypothetical protein [Candidatus Kapabacteria bacterium]